MIIEILVWCRFQKWWKFVFICLLEIAIYNLYIVFSDIVELRNFVDIDYVSFQIKLVKYLAGHEINNIINIHK